MQAIILAAGMGKRLGDLTKNKTKCMVEVNGETLICRLLNQLEQKKLSRIIIVTGYYATVLEKYISSLNIKTPISYVNNSVYDKTNNIYSLFLAKDFLVNDDTLLFESDLIFEDKILDLLIKDERKNLAVVAKYQSWMDGTCVKLNKNDFVDSFISKEFFNFSEINEYYKTVNIYKLSTEFSNKIYVPLLKMYLDLVGVNEYYESVLKFTTLDNKTKIQALKLDNEDWYEIDDVQDLDIASSIFSGTDKKYDLVMKRYGGFWRYPKLLDFCYLVNPHFPPQKLKNELISNFNDLICNYPSGLEVNCLLASKIFSVNFDYISVGNGASEFIKSVLSKFDGKFGIISPSFDEYKNRLNTNTVIYDIALNNFIYNSSDIIKFFSDKNLNNLILINPDNPTGNYIPKDEVLILLSWAYKNNINFILDESFIDFSDEDNSSFINNDILSEYKNLIVIKSISKSHGVPGLRLGVIASSNKEIIDFVKQDVSIWNINSFAEYYLQIFEKYKNSYNNAIDLFKQDRLFLQNELSKINNIKTYLSQANYIMIELLNGMKSHQVASEMLNKYNILIKDLSKKIGLNREFLRIAIRNKEDNFKLINSLKCIVSNSN